MFEMASYREATPFLLISMHPLPPSVLYPMTSPYSAKSGGFWVELQNSLLVVDLLRYIRQDSGLNLNQVLPLNLRVPDLGLFRNISGYPYEISRGPN